MFELLTGIVVYVAALVTPAGEVYPAAFTDYTECSIAVAATREREDWRTQGIVVTDCATVRFNLTTASDGQEAP